jgi:hypothetical protein
MKRILIFLCTSAILVATGILLSASLPQVPSGTWIATGPMNSARSDASTVLLQDGRILVTGGNDANGPANTAEFFGANTSFSPAAPMNVPRSGHVAVILQDARVLVTGGTTSGGGVTNSAEIYDPTASTWTNVAGGMVEARSGYTATLLNDGRVLLAGGAGSSGTISLTAEIFDPVAQTFTVAGQLSSARKSHAAALLSDGRVLIVGGSDGTNILATSDIFDPVAGAISAGPNLSVARQMLSATTLLDGRVLVAGGNNIVTNADGSTSSVDLASAEILDPGATAFSTAASALATARTGHQALLLPHNNSVLIVGGTSNGTAIASAELYIPWGGTSQAGIFQATGLMTTPRSSATGSALLQDGLLLVAGGNDASTPANTLSSAELYGFATVKTDAADYPPGTTVNITGSGWQPGEAVTLTLVESPLIDTHGPYTVTADANGNISDSSFTTDFHDLNVGFTLTATGSVSQAQTIFTDAGPKPSSTITFPAQGGSYNATGWTGTIAGTASFATGTTSRAVNVSVKRNGTTNKYWNGTAFTSSSEVFSTPTGTTSWTITFPFSNFPPDDSYTVHSVASDSNGTETGNTTATFTIDTTAPAAPSKPSLASGSDTGSSQSDSITNVTTNLKFNGTAEANSTVNLFVDGSLASSGNGTANNGGNWTNINVAGLLSEGTHTVVAKATDAASNVSLPSAALTITIDTTAPTATITAHPTDPTTSTSASFSFSGNDPTSGGVSSGVDHFLCKLDAGAFSICTSPDSLTGLATGSHTFQVEAVDVAGNTGTLVSFTWNVVSQFGVTFNAVDTNSNSLSGTVSATIVTYTGTQGGTVHSNVSLTSSGLGTPILFDAGTTVTYTYSSPVSAGTGKQYVLTIPAPIPASGFTVNSALTITGTYKIQYQVTFAQSGIPSADITGTTNVVTVNATPQAYSTLPFTAYYDSGSSITYSYASPVASKNTGEQFVLTTPSPSPTSPITVAGAGTVTGTYKIQYQVTFSLSGVSTDVSGTTQVISLSSPSVQSVNFSQFASNSYSEYLDAGSNVTYSFANPLASSTSSKQYVLNASVTPNPNPASIANLMAPAAVTATYKAQYKITLTISGLPIGLSSDTTGTVLSVTGTQAGVPVGPITKTAALLAYADFFDSGTTVNATYATPVNSTTAGKGYVLSSITGGTVTLPSTSLTVSTAATITGRYDVWTLAWGNGTTTPSFSAQYSDVTGLYTILEKNGSPVSGKSIAFCVYSVTCGGAGSDSGSASTIASGVATDTTDLHQSAAGYTASASCSQANCGVALSITHAYTITQEDASILYTGATVGQINFGLTLQATVSDSAAAGYLGINPESGPSATIGDITKMWIEFDIYQASSCGTGSPVASPRAQVFETGTLGDGIGTASMTYTSATEATYCVIARLVAGSGGGLNQWYVTPDAQTASIAFFQNAGEFATGGGWIVDPAGSHGNFANNARYGKKSAPTGQMVYVWRGTYLSVPADFIIKSTSQGLTALSFSQTAGTYPNSVLMQGGCVLQIIAESNGATLWSDGNATFTLTATDSGQNSGIGVDNFQLNVFDKNNILYKSVPRTLLSGGDIVIHVQ